MSDPSRPRLSLVKREPSRATAGPSEQLELLPPDRGVVFLLFTHGLSEHSFRSALEDARPTLVYDARRVPRFNYGTLTRRQVLGQLRERNARYFEITTLNSNRSESSAVDVVSCVRKLSVSRERVLVFFDDRPLLGESQRELSMLRDPSRSTSWHVRVLSSMFNVVEPT